MKVSDIPQRARKGRGFLALIAQCSCGHDICSATMFELPEPYCCPEIFVECASFADEFPDRARSSSTSFEEHERSVIPPTVERSASQPASVYLLSAELFLSPLAPR